MGLLHVLGIAVGEGLAAGGEFGDGGGDFVDAFGGGGVGGHKAVAAGAFGLGKTLEEDEVGFGIVAGGRGDLDAGVVGGEFLGLGVALLGDDIDAGVGEDGELCGFAAGSDEFFEGTLLLGGFDLVEAVVVDDVGDFVGEDAGEFGFIAAIGEGAAGDEDVAVGSGEGVDGGGFEYAEDVVSGGVGGGGGDGETDQGDVFLEGGVVDDAVGVGELYADGLAEGVFVGFGHGGGGEDVSTGFDEVPGFVAGDGTDDVAEGVGIEGAGLIAAEEASGEEGGDGEGEKFGFHV